MDKVFHLIIYQFKSLSCRLKNIFLVLFLLIIGLGAFIFFMLQTRVVLPKVLVCNEDSSVEAKILMNAIMNDRMRSAVEIETTDFDEGMEKIKKGQVFAMLYVRPSTISTLYEGEAVSIDLYLNDRNNGFSKMLIDYFRALTDVINVSQNTGLMYMESLYDQGFDYESRMEKFTEMQADYIQSAILRDRIFRSEDNSSLFNFLNVKLYYLSFMMFILFVLDHMIKSESLFSKEDIRMRLHLSGYGRASIELSENIVVILLTFATGLLLDNLSVFLGGNKGPAIFWNNSGYILLLSILIRTLGEILSLIFRSRIGIRISTMIVYPSVFVLSGLVVPSYLLGEVFVKINKYNPLTLIHHILAVNRMM